MEYCVKEGEAGFKLSVFLQKKLDGNNSLKQIKRWLESNRCCVNGQVERFASKRLKKGDRVRFRFEELQAAPVETLFEDNHYKVINKPAGMMSEEFQELLVHRLDKDTTGVMVLPKTREAHDLLKAQFRERSVYKRYVALVDGVPEEEGGTIKSKIAKMRENFWGDSPRGKLAVTDWKLEKAGNGYAMVHCFPKTGRTHQIRIHMNQIGHPVLGDYHYCRHFKSSLRPQRQLLHAEEIRFFHPFTEDMIAISAKLPEEFNV